MNPEDHTALTSSTGAAKNMYALAMNAIACFGLAYYRIYLDGPARQPLILAIGGMGKIQAGLLVVFWYLRGSCELSFVLMLTIPDVCLGIYFIYIWSKLDFVFCPPDAVPTRKKD